MNKGYVNSLTKRYFWKIFGALVLTVVFVCALIPLVADATEGDIVSNNRILVAGESVKDGSLEGCQIDQSLKYVLITDSKSFDLSPKNGLIPLYALHKFLYQNVSNGEAVKESVIKATSLYFDDLEKLIVSIDGYDYQDMAIDNSIVTFRYAPKGANGAQGGQGGALTVEEQILADTLPLGGYGRLYIPKLGLSIRLFEGANSEINQQYADMEDAGCTFRYGYERIVGDHGGQGFYSITNLVVGDNVYIKRPNNIIEKFSCVRCAYGVHDRQYYCDGVCLKDLNAGGICLCTCLDSTGYGMALRFFQPC